MNQWEAMIDRILHSRAGSYIYGGFMPNIQIGVNAVNENPVPADEKWFLQVVEGVIFNIADETNRGVSERFAFCRNPRYDATLQAAYERYDLARTEAVQGLVIGAACEHGVNLGDTLAVLDVLALPEVYSKLPKSEIFVQTQSALAARQRKINEMTSNGSKNFSVRTGNSNSIRYDVNGFELQFSSSGGTRHAGKGFDGMSDDEIEALYRQWVTEQRYKAMTPAQLKEIVRTGVQQNYVDKFKMDAVTNQPIANQVEALYDPTTGAAITTRKQLITYSNSSQDASKRLLCDKQGKSVPARVRAFERILNTR